MHRCRLLLALFVSFVLAATSLRAQQPKIDAPQPVVVEAKKDAPALDAGDTAWMLVSSAFVMCMVPGLALFYGGIVRRKNLLGTMMHSMIALAIVGVQWVLFGFCLAFGHSQGQIIGWNSDYLGLHGVSSNTPFMNTHVPTFVYCMYQGMFAIITPALISGAIAERIRFGPYCLFIALWSALVYCPLAHWVWAIDKDGNPVGWLGKLGAIDFAGGTVVHIAAGVSGLAAIMLLRKRIGYPQHAMHPNSMVLTLFGAGLLWFGWFGFNGGSGVASGAIAGSAFAATQCGAAAAGLTWVLIEWFHRGKPTALGLATGIVAGLVAITPASGFVRPFSGILIGAIASAVCYAVVFLKPKFKYDDSLDAFGVHGIGGFIGALLTGVFVSKALFLDSTGQYPGIIDKDGRIAQILVQLTAAVAAVIFSFVGTVVLVKVIDLVFGFCLDPVAERDGLDQAVHGEVAFDYGIAPDVVYDGYLTEPKPAMVPPTGAKHFTVVVEGSPNGELMKAWSDLCQAGVKPPSSEFLEVYPHLTTVQGNKFRFNGGNPGMVAHSLARLFEG
ncbi:MAG TPA: ammonium transporter, partial [Gemmataceae bacterium]|nr:ammonium transporter [Gemmataceae bacterium]